MKRYFIKIVLFLFGCLGLLFFTANVLEKSRDVDVFGATYMTKNNPFFVVLHQSIEEVVKANGDILISRDPCQNQEKQNEQILEMIDEGIEVLFLNPVDKEKVKPALEACEKHNVAVINIDTIVEDREQVVAIVETDNYMAGVLCAEEMMRQIDQARIVFIGNPIQTSMNNRLQGFKDTIKDNEQYQIVYEGDGAGEFEVSAEVMEQILETNISFNVILGGNDPSALGALAALQQHRKDEGVLIYSIDGSPDFKKMIKAGVVEGTCAQSPKTIGRIAAQIAYNYREGKTVEKYTSIEPEMITRENIAEYEINDWQ